jgi:hypothetical protein
MKIRLEFLEYLIRECCKTSGTKPKLILQFKRVHDFWGMEMILCEKCKENYC